MGTKPEVRGSVLLPLAAALAAAGLLTACGESAPDDGVTVSYTHLTLPTKA